MNEHMNDGALRGQAVRLQGRLLPRTTVAMPLQLAGVLRGIKRVDTRLDDVVAHVETRARTLWSLLSRGVLRTGSVAPAGGSHVAVLAVRPGSPL
jgi:hypothetical protein